MCHLDQDHVDFIKISRGEAKTRRARIRPSTSLPPPWLTALGAFVPPRDTLPPATPADVVGVTPAGRYGSTPLRFVGPIREDPALTFAGIRGLVLQDAELVNANTNLVLRPQVTDRPSDRPGLMASRQGLQREQPPDIEVIYAPPLPVPQTPGVQNMTYGDPRWGCAGRTNSDSCHDCCDAKQGIAVGVGMGTGAAVGTAAILIGVEAGALVGVWAGPVGAAIGALVGGLIGCAAALLATSECDPACDRLFPSRRQELGQRQYNLTAVLRDENGDTLGYQGVDSEGSAWVLSRDEAVAGIAGGMNIWVVDASGRRPSVVVPVSVLLISPQHAIEGS